MPINKEYKNRYKTPYRNHTKATPEYKRDEIVLKKQEGYSFGEIAKELNLTRQRVHQIWSKAVAIQYNKINYIIEV